MWLLFSGERAAQAASGIFAVMLAMCHGFFFLGSSTQSHSAQAFGTAEVVFLQPQGFDHRHSLPSKDAAIGCAMPPFYFYFYNLIHDSLPYLPVPPTVILS